jgi:hypothetical protein
MKRIIVYLEALIFVLSFPMGAAIVNADDCADCCYECNLEYDACMEPMVCIQIYPPPPACNSWLRYLFLCLPLFETCAEECPCCSACELPQYVVERWRQKL